MFSCLFFLRKYTHCLTVVGNELCVCMCVSLVSKPRNSKTQNTKYIITINIRKRERERERNDQKARDRSAVKSAFRFCILRSKLRPTWQLEDSSVYNVVPSSVSLALSLSLSLSFVSQHGHNKNETRLTAAQRKS